MKSDMRRHCNLLTASLTTIRVERGPKLLSHLMNKEGYVCIYVDKKKFIKSLLWTRFQTPSQKQDFCTASKEELQKGHRQVIGKVTDKVANTSYCVFATSSTMYIFSSTKISFQHVPTCIWSSFALILPCFMKPA